MKSDNETRSLSPAPFFDRDVQYSAQFDEKSHKLHADFDDIKTCITTCIPNRDKSELREVKIQASTDFSGELICYFEPILTEHDTHQAHPAFSKLFLETKATHNGVLVRRRPRVGRDFLYLSFICSGDGASFSTSREKALGRGGFDEIGRLVNKPLQLSEALSTLYWQSAQDITWRKCNDSLFSLFWRELRECNSCSRKDFGHALHSGIWSPRR